MCILGQTSKRTHAAATGSGQGAGTTSGNRNAHDKEPAGGYGIVL